MFDPKIILIPVEVDIDNYKSWLPVAFQACKRFDADAIHIFFVNDPQAGYRHPGIDADELKNRVTDTLDPSLLTGLTLEYGVSRGELGTEVNEYCDEHGIELIITSHKHHSRIFGHLFDTRDETIIDAVEVPVLVIPKPKEA